MERRISKLKTVCEEFEKMLMAKPEADAIEVLNTKINNPRKFIQNYKKEVTMKESYGKRLNSLINKITEDENQSWEEKR